MFGAKHFHKKSLVIFMDFFVKTEPSRNPQMINEECNRFSFGTYW